MEEDGCLALCFISPKAVNGTCDDVNCTQPHPSPLPEQPKHTALGAQQ
jgi:hypothetical protein